MPIRISLYGPLRVARGGRDMDLPKSKKTLALLAYLVVTGRPQPRERLCELLWSGPADPRAALRWSLNQLRQLLGPDVVLSDDDTIALRPEAVTSDRHDVHRFLAGMAGGTGTAPAETVVSSISGEFLENIRIANEPDFESWCVLERGAARQDLARLLALLIARLRDTPERAIPHARHLTRIEPDDEGAQAELIRLLFDAGRKREAAEYYELAHRQQKALGNGPPYLLERTWGELQSGKGAAGSGKGAAPASEALEPLRQRIHFCTTDDHVRIAYSVTGDGPPIVKTANWLSHLDYDLDSPIWQHLVRMLARGRRLLRYDQRGCGLSDRLPEDISFGAFCRDLDAVVEAADIASFDLLGISHGCAVAVDYAVNHPGRVRRLVLIGGSAKGWRRRSPDIISQREMLVVLAREGWGLDTPAFRQVFTSLMFPDATPEQNRWFNDLQRKSASQEVAARIMDALGEYDVTPLLSRIRCPTLFLHSVDDGMIPFQLGRDFATGLPDAQFVPLPSRNHLILENEPAWPVLDRHITEFLAA